MARARGKRLQDLLFRSLSGLAALLSFGLFGRLGKNYASLKCASGRFEFVADYALVALFLAMILSALYRFILYFGILDGFGYWVDRAAFALAMSPALYLLFLGQIRRLNDLGFWRGFVLLNFVPGYGLFCMIALLSLCPRFLRR